MSRISSPFILPTDADRLRARLKPRQAWLDPPLVRQVLEVFEDVQEHGDAALHDHIRNFDGVDLDTTRVTCADVDSAVHGLLPDLRAAIEHARANIEEVNRALLP
jgi:histidinol dehydrogenase